MVPTSTDRSRRIADLASRGLVRLNWTGKRTYFRPRFAGTCTGSWFFGINGPVRHGVDERSDNDGEDPRDHACLQTMVFLPPMVIPALLERTSRRPNSPIAPSTALIQSSSLRTSRWTKRHVPPVWSIAAATLAPPASFTSATTILAPSSAISSAADRPMPDAPPATSATLSLRRFMSPSPSAPRDFKTARVRGNSTEALRNLGKGSVNETRARRRFGRPDCQQLVFARTFSGASCALHLRTESGVSVSFRGPGDRKKDTWRAGRAMRGATGEGRYLRAAALRIAATASGLTGEASLPQAPRT